MDLVAALVQGAVELRDGLGPDAFRLGGAARQAVVIGRNALRGREAGDQQEQERDESGKWLVHGYFIWKFSFPAPSSK